MRRVALLVLGLGFGACAPTVQAEAPLEVTYYYLEYCRICSATRASLARLEGEYPGQVSVRMLVSTHPEAQEAVKVNDWRSHGAVVKRGPKVVRRLPDHRATGYEIQKTVADLLGYGPECRSPGG